MTAITGPRTEGWRLTWTSGADVVDLPLVLYSGGHDWHIDRAIPLGMSCQLGPRLADGSPLPDLRDGWIHATHIINGTAHPIGKFRALGRPRHLSRTGDTYSLSAADPTCLLDRAGLRSRVTYAAGTPIAETVRALVTLYTPSVIAIIGDTDETLREHLTFDAGTSVLEVCNKLLAAAAYTRLAPRVDGTLWSARWSPASQRPVVMSFGPGMASHLPDVDLEDDAFTRPTEVIARTRGGQDAEPIIGRWPDVTPPEPITEVIDVDATTVEAATLLARQRYEEAQQVTRWTTITGPWQPIAPGEVARFANPRRDLDLLAELQQLRTRWTVGSPTAYSLQEVHNG